MKTTNYEKSGMGLDSDTKNGIEQGGADRKQGGGSQQDTQKNNQQDGKTQQEDSDIGSGKGAAPKSQHKKLAVALAMSLLAGSLAVSAAPYENWSHNDYNSGYATVTHITPHYGTYVRNEERSGCETTYGYGNHYRNRYDDNDHNHNTRNGIVGAVIGGAIGNQFGKGDGRKAATIGGAVIGGTIGANHDRHDRYNHNYRNDYYDNDNVSYQNDEGASCRHSFVPVSYQKINGYDVQYTYQGEYGHVFTTEYPQGGYILIQ